MNTDVIKLESVTQFNTERGQRTLHPLVSILEQSKSKLIETRRYISELYIIFFKDVRCEDIKYGRSHYDYQAETLIFISPGQVFGFDEPSKLIQPNGWALVIHPDFFRGTSLGRNIQHYSFFSYDTSEALHVSDREKQVVMDCFYKIKEELEQNIDKHSKTLVISRIELFLNYCMRFYERQFIMREEINKDILVRFETLLSNYFQSELPQTIGLPSVSYCADKLHISPNYFGDLVKKETGITAQEFIHRKVIDLAKEIVFDRTRSISEIGYGLGFKYPSHFTRLFKQYVGQSPNEYRMLMRIN